MQLKGILFLGLIFAVSSLVAANEVNSYSYVGKDGVPCGLLRCRLRCRYGLQLDDNRCPACACVERTESLCLDKTKTWICYGAHTSLDIFPETSQGPLVYVDGQSTTGLSGHVAELEYVANEAGIEVRFMIFQLVDPMKENVLRITHEFRHTAPNEGMIKIPLDLRVPEKSRIGFMVAGDSPVPMNYRFGQYDGRPYMSFIQVPKGDDVFSFDEGSANRQYNFRLCYDIQTTEVSCPTPAPTTEGISAAGRMQPIPTTTTTSTTTTTASTTVAIASECESCRTLCPFGYLKDEETGCNICDRCIVLGPPGGGGNFGGIGGVMPMPGPAGPETGVVTPDPCDIVCTQQWEPICGSNNVTYGNTCAMRQGSCALGIDIVRVHRGECGNCEFACFAIWQPVCGTDSVIYSNQCTLFLSACKSSEPLRSQPMEHCS